MSDSGDRLSRNYSNLCSLDRYFWFKPLLADVYFCRGGGVLSTQLRFLSLLSPSFFKVLKGMSSTRPLIVQGEAAETMKEPPVQHKITVVIQLTVPVVFRFDFIRNIGAVMLMETLRDIDTNKEVGFVRSEITLEKGAQGPYTDQGTCYVPAQTILLDVDESFLYMRYSVKLDYGTPLQTEKIQGHLMKTADYILQALKETIVDQVGPTRAENFTRYIRETYHGGLGTVLCH